MTKHPLEIGPNTIQSGPGRGDTPVVIWRRIDASVSRWRWQTGEAGFDLQPCWL